MAPLLLRCRNYLAKTSNANTASDLGQFRQRKLCDFFLCFNDLLDNLLHDFLRPLRSFLIRGNSTRFSADRRVDVNVTVTCRKRQAPTLAHVSAQRIANDF